MRDIWVMMSAVSIGLIGCAAPADDNNAKFNEPTYVTGSNIPRRHDSTDQSSVQSRSSDRLQARPEVLVAPAGPRRPTN